MDEDSETLPGPSDQVPRFDVFISYSSQDKAIASEIAKACSDRGFKTWFDQWSELPREGWAKSVQRAIAGSRMCVVIVSKHSEGAWQEAGEWPFIQRNVWARPDFTVVPVKVGEDTQLPQFLRHWRVVSLPDQRTEVSWWPKGPAGPEVAQVLAEGPTGPSGPNIQTEMEVEKKNRFRSLAALISELEDLDRTKR